MRLTQIIRKIIHFLSLESELDDLEKIHETIVKESILKGTNLWILVFAIIVASVGLNMNSTAVIIGAMLISPLMGPINGMGYSIATHNYELFRKALNNFLFAVAASLVASTIYFALSPVSTAHSEILARTAPTIYDVLIALFGGLAGIVAISSKHKGNVIPGVAIATALMPPLCTAGYGLATGQLYYFFGAFYLFTINSVFIALASIVVSQVLKFPIRTIVDPDRKKKTNRWISFVIVLILLPSIYFGYGLVQKEKFITNANKYIATVSAFEGNYLLKSEIDATNKTITLIYAGINLDKKQKESINQRAERYNLADSKIVIKQGLSFNNFSGKDSEIFTLKEQLSRLNSELKEKVTLIDSLTNNGKMGQTILKELKTIFPQFTSCTYAESLEFNDKITTPTKKIIVILALKDNRLTNLDKNRVRSWLKTRLNNDDINVIYE